MFNSSSKNKKLRSQEKDRWPSTGNKRKEGKELKKEKEVETEQKNKESAGYE